MQGLIFPAGPSSVVSRRRPAKPRFPFDGVTFYSNGTQAGEAGMKVVLLTVRLGTRLSKEAYPRPQPILWHIVKLYSHHGPEYFVICCGYKSYTIKEYFSNDFLNTADVTIDMASGYMDILGAILGTGALPSRKPTCSS